MHEWFSKQYVAPYFAKRRMETVRGTFHVVALTALFFGIAAVTMQDASYVSITTNPTNVIEGEDFTITVRAHAHTPINAVDVIIEYPETHMTVESIDTGNSVITLWTEEPYTEGGRVHLRGGVFQRGFLGDHEIARIQARATETGTALVTVGDVAFVAGDGKGTTISAEQGDEHETRIYVTPSDGKLASDVSVSIVTDIDGDGAVGLSDISAFMAAWFSKAKVFDFNRDGRMTFRDFSILLADSFFK